MVILLGEHIWRDKIHLNHEGTIILANNYLHLNVLGLGLGLG